MRAVATVLICSVNGCEKRVLARGWCGTHYARWRKTGDVGSSPVRKLRPLHLTFEEAFRWHLPNCPRGQGCTEWPSGITSEGYGYFDFDCKRYGAHVASYLVHVGEVPKGLQVLHNPEVCNNRRCVNPDHLRVGTPDDNMQDRKIAGTFRGEDVHWMTKLTESDVVEIREAVASGDSQSQVAARYGINRATISYIVSRKTWAHV